MTSNTEEFLPIPEDLRKFINRIGHKLITVAILPDKKGLKYLTTEHFPAGTWYAAFDTKAFTSIEVQTELRLHNANGFGIFYMINEGDGISYDNTDGKLNCGKRKNVTNLTTLAIDTDAADGAALMNELNRLNFRPHVIIRSSVKDGHPRYHLYFFIHPEPAVGENVIMWQALQKKLASLVPGLDKSMCEINQLLRLPGYLHMKGEPQDIMTSRSTSDELFTLKHIFDRLEAHQYAATLAPGPYSGNGVSQKPWEKFTMPEKRHSLEEGERRNTICRYIEHVMENVVPIDKTEEIWMHVDNFIEAYCKPQDAALFLPGGERRPNIEKYLEEQRERRYRIKATQDAAIAAAAMDEVEAVEEEHLPDVFYLNFPGDLGMLTREFHNFSPKTSCELCFAAALSVSGALKAEYLRFHGAWPMVNGFLVAPTGAGKSLVKHIVETCLRAAGLKGNFPQLLDFTNSVQALHDDLYRAGGVGTLFIDESGDYLKGMMSEKAGPHLQGIRKYFKEATSGRAQGAYLHPGRSRQYTRPAIDGGFLSLWLLIQPSVFTSMMNLSDMADGFMPRFFIFRGSAIIEFGTTGAAFSPSLDLRAWMEGMVNAVPYSQDNQLEKTCEEAAAAHRVLYPKAQPESVIQAQIDAVYRTRSESRRMLTQELQTTSEAQALLDEYLEEVKRRAVRVQSDDEENPQLGIFVRVEEMLHRLICCASSPGQPISKQTVEHIIRFHRFQAERFFRRELLDMSAGEYERTVELVKRGIAKAVKRVSGPATQREINQSMKSTSRPKNLAVILKDLDARGEVYCIERAHKTAVGKKVKTYSLTPPEDMM